MELHRVQHQESSGGEWRDCIERVGHSCTADRLDDGQRECPFGNSTPLQYIRYDKYTANEYVTPHAFVAVPGYAEDYHRKTVGRVTATKTRVLGTEQWITSTVYYDSKCRPMQEITDNLVGGVTRVTHSYDFVGNVVKSQEAHGANTLEYAYTYDDRSRLLNVTASFNGATPVTMKTLEYDEVGRLKKVKLHNNTTSSEYDYNIRSWPTGITGSKFSQSLSYDNGNGNIRSMNWSADGSNHSYSFTYDGANRMLDAIHGTGAYTEKVTNYDKNGNIMGLQRYGNGLIDNLTYTYNGNQLTQVEDATGNSAGFNNGASTANEYTYDYNGNLTKDSNKGICNISWNSLNLPNVVTFEDGSTVTYLYAADGTKLRTLHNINGTTTQKDYCGSVIYENGAAKFWQTEAGYISMNDSKYHYYLQDHQGNNRVVINSSGTVQETNHYYPFGGVFASTGNVQPYKYNGKELDTSKGLNWYDYGARHYDAALGRWFGVDPLAEKYNSTSEYGYCLNNPVKYIDPYGKDVYGFDVNTGRLSIIEYNKDDFDKINLGVFDENNIFTITDKDNSLELFKGILLGKHFDDISKSGIVFLEGFLNEGIKMMKFLSFNSNIEFSAWAFHTDYGIGLSISPWILNETIINQDYIKMSSLDFYRNQEKVGYLGNKYFKIHTHPGSKNGLGGNGIPSDSDYKLMKGNEKYPHYILSKKDGIVQYFLNKTYKKTSIR